MPNSEMPKMINVESSSISSERMTPKKKKELDMLEMMRARKADFLESINKKLTANDNVLEMAKAESTRKESDLKECQAAKDNDRLDREESDQKCDKLCALIDQTHERLMNFPPEGAPGCRLRLQSRLDALMEKEKKLSKQLDLNTDH